jgi:hypothetical protein
MTSRAGWLLALAIATTAAPQALGGSPIPAPTDSVPTVWTGAPNSEVVGSRWMFFQTDDFRAGWYVRAGPTEATIGLRGDYYLGAGWNVNVGIGANIFHGLTVTGRLEWHAIEDTMFAAEWTETGVRIAWWQACDWDFSSR